MQSTTQATSNSNSAKVTLLKFGLLPDYRCIQRSEEALENFLTRSRKDNNNCRSHDNESEGGESKSSRQLLVPLLPLDDEETCQQIAILHSLFANFCHPPPSIESIVFIFLLEQQRVSSPQTTLGSKASIVLENCIQQPLPKEALMHTSSNSAQFVINLLRSNPKSCLLKLPLEFQLSFFRILTRLLASEGDAEYDDECLFDWSSLEYSTNNSQGDESSASINEHKLGGDGGTDSDDDDSYDLVRKLSIISGRERTSCYSSNDHKVQNHRDTAASTTSHSSFPRTSGGSFNTGKVFETWSFGKWKKKKSAPLYSVIRFCSNPAWESIHSTNSKRRSRHWNFVADNVKLCKEEEEALLNEDTSSGSDEENEGDSLSTYRADDDKTLGIFIRAYHAILDNSLKHNEGDSVGQYLLLGPVAHLKFSSSSASSSSSAPPPPAPSIVVVVVVVIIYCNMFTAASATAAVACCYYCCLLSASFSSAFIPPHATAFGPSAS